MTLNRANVFFVLMSSSALSKITRMRHHSDIGTGRQQ